MTKLDHLLQIRAPADLEEWVQGLLFLSECSGVSVSSDGTLEAYFNSPERRDRAAELLCDPRVTIESHDVERKDWLAMYQQSLVAMEIGERFVVAPDAGLIGAQDRLPIVIPQEQAFGTGSHETTALCLELLEGIPLEGKRGLDVGTGSGILAIAMLRLGAARVLAIDNDPDTFAALRLNRRRNAVDPVAMPLLIGHPDSIGGGQFDVVTMNILPDVIIDLLPGLRPRLSGGGWMILSGVLLTQRERVTGSAASRGFTVVGERSRGEWWAGVLQVVER